MVRYPKELPLPLVASRRNKITERLIRTDMKSGLARQRRAFEVTPTIVSATFTLIGNEALVFEFFVRDAINAGADWFIMPLRFPDGLSDRRVRFAETHSGSDPIGPNIWRVKAELEVLPVYDPSFDGWGEFPQYIAGASLLDLIVNEQWPLA